MTRQVPGAEIRRALIEKREIAFLDLREEAPFAEAHPLFAACLPLGRIETEIFDRVPRRDTEIVLYNNGETLIEPALTRLATLGYTNLAILENDLQGWRDGGGEVFIDVNVPSKAFGELVEAKRHTPSYSAEEVKALIDGGADIAILDARRFDEYRTMNIPGSVSVPGAELVLRAKSEAPRKETTIIVNCAGRTRSIIGTQSLVNAGIPNKVAALRNGTIGWKLAGFDLDTDQTRRFGDHVDAANQATAQEASYRVATEAGVEWVGYSRLATFDAETSRTTYRFDVRTPEEYREGHWPGFRSAPGGQLVQETDVFAPVRGARIVLADDDGVRANMTASWLAQMGWDVVVIDDPIAGDLLEHGDWCPSLPSFPPLIDWIDTTTLATWLAANSGIVVDLASSQEYIRGHIPGAWFALRSELAATLKSLPAEGPLILTSTDGALAGFAAAEILALTTPRPVFVLSGGTQRWFRAGYTAETGATKLASPFKDRYRRPYEGTDNPATAMQAYLDWEYGLVDQLARDNTHGFFVI